MKRHVCVYFNEGQQQNSIGIENVHINSIDMLINHSVDTIFCEALEFLSEPLAKQIFSIMLQKIRPEGYLALKIINAKQVCIDYTENRIHNQDFIKLFNQKNSLFSTDTIYALLDTSLFKILKIESHDNLISFMIKRIAI